MRNEIVIHASAQRIFERAAATERWPEILPHYRFVNVLSRDGDRRVVEMGAKRQFKTLTFNVRWQAEQINDGVLPQIYFKHLGGWTAGMDVYWRFKPLAGGTRVIIDHELRSPLAPIIGKFFIDPIATRTLACMKALAEENA